MAKDGEGTLLLSKEGTGRCLEQKVGILGKSWEWVWYLEECGGSKAPGHGANREKIRRQLANAEKKPSVSLSIFLEVNLRIENELAGAGILDGTPGRQDGCEHFLRVEVVSVGC